MTAPDPTALREHAAALLPGWQGHFEEMSPETRDTVFRVLAAVSSFLSDRHAVVKREITAGLREGARGKLTVRERQILDAYFAAVQSPLLALVTLAEPEPTEVTPT